MIWEIHMGVFYTFNKARRSGQPPGWMSGWGESGGVIFMSLLYYMFQSILNTFAIGDFFGPKN